MASRSLNRLRNGKLAWARGRLPQWKLAADGGRARISPLNAEEPATRLHSASTRTRAFVEQVREAREGRHFRVEAMLRCALESKSPGGAVLIVEALDARGRVIEERATREVLSAPEFFCVRAYYETPKGTRRLRVRVGIHRARGTLDVRHVALFSILEPEWRAHPLALPPPQESLPAPRDARRIGICTRVADRPLIGALANACFPPEGEHSVRRVDPMASRDEIESFDAVLMPDDAPPRAAATLPALYGLAQDRVVVISLPAFAALTSHRARVRRVEQRDDPLHAYVASAGHATRGFALHDAFPMGWPGEAAGSFALRQFTRTAELKRLCQRDGLVPLLKSLGNLDSTSDRIVALHQPAAGGGLFVLDLLSLEAPASSLGEPTPLMTLLLNILGRREAGAGQYAVPVRTEGEFRALLREMPVRWSGCRLHEADVPSEGLDSQLVEIEPRDAAAAADRPIIVIRSGLRAGDLESVFSAWMFIKGLLRTPQAIGAYAKELLGRYRLVWQPLCADWQDAAGWRRSGSAARPAAQRHLLNFLAGARVRLASLVDLLAAPGEHVRCGVRHDPRLEGHVRAWLPRLWAAFAPGAACRWTTSSRTPHPGPHDGAWRTHRPALDIPLDHQTQDDPVQEWARLAGAAVWRLEIPGSEEEFVARSIETTGIGVTLLEQVAGLHYGLIAVNRRACPVEFPPFAPVAPGRALIVPSHDASLTGMAETA